MMKITFPFKNVKNQYLAYPKTSFMFLLFQWTRRQTDINRCNSYWTSYVYVDTKINLEYFPTLSWSLQQLNLTAINPFLPKEPEDK